VRKPQKTSQESQWTGTGGPPQEKNAPKKWSEHRTLLSGVIGTYSALKHFEGGYREQYSVFIKDFLFSLFLSFQLTVGVPRRSTV
jgi:hypothetical protein